MLNSIIAFINRYRNIFFLLIIASVVAIFGYIIYFLIFREAIPDFISRPEKETHEGQFPESKEGTGQISTSTDGISVLPGTQNIKSAADPIASGGLTETKKMTDDKTSFFAIDKSGNFKYYNKSDGKFYSMDRQGNRRLMDDKIFHDAENITWSKKDNLAIIEYPDGANIIYDFDRKKQTTLPAHWEGFDFSENNSIVLKSIGYDPENRWLAVTNPEGSETRAIEFLGDNAGKVQTGWSPNNQVIALYTEGETFNRQTTYLVGLQHENFKSIPIDGRGFEFSWSPDGNRLLYSVYSSDSDLKPTLWAINANGESVGTGKTSLGLNTWAKKCVFSGKDEVFCAVPEQLKEGAGLFPELAMETKDNIYHINIKTGQKSLLAMPDGSFNISSLMVSKDGSELYFTDIRTENAYSLRIK